VNGFDAPYLVYYVVLLVAVVASLVAMRLPIGKTVKMALAWVAIFGIGFVVMSYRSELGGIGKRLRSEAMGSAIVEDGTVRVPVGEDGHFWVEAEVNGHPLRFMVDSGASVTTVSRDSAAAAGLPIGGQRTIVQTANGPATAIQGSADRFEIGPIKRTDFPVDINEHDDTNLLGMNFLRSLSSWRVEGHYLVLEP
jgi:aspartyl protease family protein